MGKLSIFGSPIGFMPNGFRNSLEINFEKKHSFIFWLAEKQGMQINSPFDIIHVYYSGLRDFKSVYEMQSSDMNGIDAYIKVLSFLIMDDDFCQRSIELMNLAAEWKQTQIQPEKKVSISGFVDLLK
jgi:hypothetical protein